MAILNNVVQHRRGTVAQFNTSTTILKDGEIAVAKTADGKKIAYVGDGVTELKDLSPMAINAEDVIGLNEYVTETELTGILDDYVTTDELESTLTGYVTFDDVKTPVTDTNKIVTEEDIKTIEGAMHFIDVITRTEGQTDLEAIAAYFTVKGTTPVAGDVVVMADNTKEYVFNKDNAWREIGDEDGTSAKIQALSDRLTDDETVINQLTSDVNALDDEIADIETQLTSYSDVEAAAFEYEEEKDSYLKTLTMNGTENVVVDNALYIGTVVTDAEILNTTLEEGISSDYAVDISEDGKLTINITGIDAGEITED